jgi:hypothetical protein
MEFGGLKGDPQAPHGCYKQTNIVKIVDLITNFEITAHGDIKFGKLEGDLRPIVAITGFD